MMWVLLLLAHVTFCQLLIISVHGFLPCTPSRNSLVVRQPIREIDSSHCSPLMGIKGFRSWYETTFPSAVVTINRDRFNNSNRGRKGGSNDNSSRSSKFQPETFDHVLIDANQFLHTTLRKAYTRRAMSNAGRQELDDDIIDHALLLLLKELNQIATTAIPRKSIVIALDGSPGAAKLEMQRKRRFSIYKKAESQERQIQVLKERGWRDNDFGFFSNSARKKNNNPFSKHDRERVSLNITPGTAFMDRVTDALLYWSWQYVSRCPNHVQVYISPSYVHGEGEVKLLDWILRGHEPSISSQKSHRTNVKQDETIAIIGGDSDLVLMGLVVPPNITHNIHVILPGEKGKSMVASVWETTRSISRMIEGTATYGKKAKKTTKNKKRKRTLTLQQVNQARIDTALLVIMSGNDYLPKLRGCRTGFDSFFEAYLERVQFCMDTADANHDPFLINVGVNGELYMNVPFALSFYKALALKSQLPTSYRDSNDDSASSLQSQLGYLVNLAEAKILPNPISFDVISPEESYFHQELWEMNSKMDQNVVEEVFADGAEIVRLTLGNFPEGDVTSLNTTIANADSSHEIFTTVLGEADGHGVISRMIRSENNKRAGGRAYVFEVPHRQQISSIKTAKHRLSTLALEEIFGEDIIALFGGNGSQMSEYGTKPKDSLSQPEKPQGLPDADAASYLGGLLWNLETYQHGCSADYGFVYGRASPTPVELVRCLEDLKQQGKLKITCADLIGHSSATPLSDKLACLAAVPPQAWSIVPAPYSLLVEPSRSEKFEDIYNSCFHQETNAFDIQLFEKQCNAELSKIDMSKAKVSKRDAAVRGKGKGNSKKRHIYAGSTFWTVIGRTDVPLERPFEPPAPFSERVLALRRNRRIRATKLPVRDRVDKQIDTGMNGSQSEMSENRGDNKNTQSVHEIPFKTAFKNRNHK